MVPRLEGFSGWEGVTSRKMYEVGGGPWMRALNICILMEMWRW